MKDGIMKKRLSTQIILVSIGASLMLFPQLLSARDGFRGDYHNFTPQQRGENPRNRFNRRNNNNNRIDSNETNSAEKIALGGALFNDTSLSLTKTQSCASCHNPTQAFIDNRENSVQKAVSVGDDGVSLGDRNAPMVTYSAFSPEFSATRNGFRGGQFWNGSAKNLTEQAKGPFLNPVEMQMPDAQSVVERVSENSSYIEQLQAIYEAHTPAVEPPLFIDR
jgi:cytochrome c peroxidase